MEYVIILLLIVLIILTYINLKNRSNIDLTEYESKISTIEKNNVAKEETIKNLQKYSDVLQAKMESFEQLKTEKIQLNERLKNVENERNSLKTKNTKLENNEELRNEKLRTSLEKSNALQESLEKEKQRLNDERVVEIEKRQEEMKKQWRKHEQDVQNHIQMICKNYLLEYISQEQFPYPRNKPDNTIEISSQLIVFDAKSPLNNELNNFPKYIKSQTENLKKYAKHSNVKKELFLVVPSNTLSVIEKFTYNMGDYTVYVVTKDSLEPIILSLKRIQDFDLVDKLSPEERDDICRIIGKFAHNTKRKIQIDQYFTDEFLDTLKKARTQLPKEILKSVIEFESAEMLNPPMEKRNKKILTKELLEKRMELTKEIEIRDIPEIDAKITFKEKDEGDDK